MTEDKKGDSVIARKDVVTTLGAASAAAASAFAVTPADPQGVVALAAVLTAVFPPVLAAMTEAGVRRMKARADRFFDKLIDEWKSDTSKTPEEIARQLVAAKEDPNVADTIWRAVRGLMEAPNDEAAVPLGVLVAEYTRDKRPADAFFRGVVRLLQELEAAEFGELRRMLDWLTSNTNHPAAHMVAVTNSVIIVLDDVENDVVVEGRPMKRTTTIKATDPARLFTLLTSNHLAVVAQTSQASHAQPRISIQRNTAERVLRLLGS